MENHICDTHRFNMELVPRRCHRRMQRRWPYVTPKPISSAYSQGCPMTFHQAYGIGYYRKPKSPSISFDNLMPPQMCQHTPTSVDHSATTKCRLPQWDATRRYMRKPTNVAHGHFIQWMDGIYSHHPNTIAHTIATLNTPRANAYLTLCNSNTNASLIPPSHMRTK